jgi:hypothetical protein
VVTILLLAGWQAAIAGEDGPDLEVGTDAWDSPDPVDFGDSVDFRVEIANSGAETDAELIVEGFAGAYQLERAFVQRPGPGEARDQCAIDQDAGQVQCLFVELGRDSGLTVEIRAVAQLAGEHSITASLTSPSPDLDEGNNMATQTNTVTGDTPETTPSPPPSPTQPTATETPESTVTAGPGDSPEPSDEDDGSDEAVLIAAIGALLLAGGAALLVWLRTRSRQPDS